MSRIASPFLNFSGDPRIVDGGMGREIDPRFNAWLQAKLHKIYDDIVSEPLPADLTALVKRLDERTPAS